MARVHWLLVSVVMASAVSSAAFGQSASVLLEKGIYTEETVGDLEGAIKVYQKIIDEAESNRSHIAQAYYRLGMCYLKKGHNEAANAAFEKLIARFPEEKMLVAQARKQMPGAPFPEFVGCRVKKVVSLAVAKGKKFSAIPKPQTVFENSLLELKWEVDANIAKKTKHFVVGVSNDANIENQDAWLWRAVGVPSKMRSATYGQSWPAGSEKPHPLTVQPEHLSAGEYSVFVFAYDTNPEEFDGDDVIGSGAAKLTVQPAPYTQITINDIQADGIINFRNIIQETNRSSKPFETKRFINSDFVKLERMVDDQGRPINFTAKHDGSIYRYNVTLNEPVSAGEALLYASDGTVVDMVKPFGEAGNEFRYALTHSPAAGQTTRRIELYLLPKGAELLETTPNGMAQRTRDGRIELFVEKMIPAGGNITTAFRYRLAGANLAKDQPLKLEPAPWPDGEVMRLRFATRTGVEVGTHIWTADSVRVHGKDAWRIEQYLFVSAQNYSQFSRVDAEVESFAPIFGHTKNQMGDFRADYREGKVDLKTEISGKESSRQIKVDGVAFDNEQALYTIRRMPLAEGYRGSFPIFPVTGATVVECRIEVVGKEKLDVPAGTFNCYKLELAVYAGMIKALQHELWFSADEHKHLVKYDAGTAVMELVEVTRRHGEKGESLQDEELGISVTTPVGWYLYRNPSPGPHRMLLQLLPPELRAWSVLSIGERTSGKNSPKEVAQGDVERVKGYFKNYTVRSASWSDLEVNSLPAASYIADYQDKGKDMVEYRSYVVGKSMVYWFVFRIEKSDFDANKGEFDAIVKSFKAK